MSTPTESVGSTFFQSDPTIDQELEYALHMVDEARTRLARISRDRSDIEAFAGSPFTVFASAVQKGLSYEWQTAADLYTDAQEHVASVLARLEG